MHVFSTGKLAHLRLVGTLTKLAPHGIEHEFNDDAFTQVVLHVLDIQMNAFMGLVARTMLLALFRCRAMRWKPASLYFQFEPGEDIVSKELDLPDSVRNAR